MYPDNMKTAVRFYYKEKSIESVGYASHRDRRTHLIESLKMQLHVKKAIEYPDEERGNFFIHCVIPDKASLGVTLEQHDQTSTFVQLMFSGLTGVKSKLSELFAEHEFIFKMYKTDIPTVGGELRSLKIMSRKQGEQLQAKDEEIARLKALIVEQRDKILALQQSLRNRNPVNLATMSARRS